VGPLIVISLLFALGSYGIIRWARHQETKGQAVDQAAPVPLAELAQDAASVAAEMGAGSFRQTVKIRGRLGCEAPLIAELSHTPCVSYRFSVTREYEEVLWEKDSEGRSYERRQRRSEVVASNQASTGFWIDDGTARMPVHPDQAEIERIKSHESFQPVTAPTASFGVGSFVLSLTAHPGGTLGYRYEEECLPVGHEVTIVAEAGDTAGVLALRKPEAAGAPFLVTPKDFGELARSHRRTTAVLKGLAMGMAAVAVLIFLLGVVR